MMTFALLRDSSDLRICKDLYGEITIVSDPPKENGRKFSPAAPVASIFDGSKGLSPTGSGRYWSLRPGR